MKQQTPDDLIIEITHASERMNRPFDKQLEDGPRARARHAYQDHASGKIDQGTCDDYIRTRIDPAIETIEFKRRQARAALQSDYQSRIVAARVALEAEVAEAQAALDRATARRARFYEALSRMYLTSQPPVVLKQSATAPYEPTLSAVAS